MSSDQALDIASAAAVSWSINVPPTAIKDVESLAVVDNPMAFKQFTNYTKLPEELKLRILKLSFPANRVVEVRFANTTNSEQYDFAADVPASLQVCHMWRIEAKKVYSMIQGSVEPAQQIYIDFERDSLYLRYSKWHGDVSWQARAFGREFPQRSLLKYLIAPPGVLMNDIPVSKMLPPILGYFVNLETVRLGIQRNFMTYCTQCAFCLACRQLRKDSTLILPEEVAQMPSCSASAVYQAAVANFLPKVKTETAAFVEKVKSHNNAWLSPNLKLPEFSFGVFSHAMIPRQKLHCRPRGYKIHNTRGRKKSEKK